MPTLTTEHTNNQVQAGELNVPYTGAAAVSCNDLMQIDVKVSQEHFEALHAMAHGLGLSQEVFVARALRTYYFLKRQVQQGLHIYQGYDERYVDRIVLPSEEARECADLGLIRLIALPSENKCSDTPTVSMVVKPEVYQELSGFTQCLPQFLLDGLCIYYKLKRNAPVGVRVFLGREDGHIDGEVEVP